MSTELRQLIKNSYEGDNLTTLLHPLTQVEDPETLRLTQEEINTKLSQGLISEVFDDGSKSSIDSKVDYDLANAESIYNAFSVVNGDTVALAAAIDAYGISQAITRDDIQILTDTIVAAIDLIKITAMDLATLKANYPRNSTGSYTITLEVLANYLKIPFTGDTSDDDLAGAILGMLIVAP